MRGRGRTCSGAPVALEAVEAGEPVVHKGFDCVVVNGVDSVKKERVKRGCENAPVGDKIDIGCDTVGDVLESGCAADGIHGCACSRPVVDNYGKFLETAKGRSRSPRPRP